MSGPSPPLAHASDAASASPEPDHRFTLSDYYSLENIDPLRTSPPPSLVHRQPPRHVQTHSNSQTETLMSSHTGNSNSYGNSIPFASSSRNRPAQQTLPTIITTASPTLPSPSRSAENSLQLDLFEVEPSPRRLSSSSTGSRPSDDPLGVMSHPLGPGPQPYPASPDGHQSDPEEYIPSVTYPPRGYYPNSTPTRAHPMASPTSGRDLQREIGMGERALAAGPAQASASTAYAQFRPMPSHSPVSSPGDIGLNQPQSPMALSPSASSYRRPSQATSDVSYDARPTLNRAPTSPFEDEKLPEKELAIASTSRALSSGQQPRSKTRHVMRDWFPKSWPCRLLMLAVFLEAAIDISIQANILWRFHMEYDTAETEQDKTLARLPVYLYIFVTAHIVQLGLTFWAIRTRNTIQVIGLAVFNCLFLIYSGIESQEIRAISDSLDEAVADETNRLLSLPIKVLSIVSICVIAASVVAVAILSWYIWREFGWDIYRSLGADLRIRRYYFQYQVFECIVCFSFFFFVGFGVQFALTVLRHDEAEYYLTWIMVPVLVFWLAMGLVSARFEWAYIMALFLFGLLGGTAYFIFKLVRIWTQQEIYRIVAKSLTVFSVLSLLMIILTLVYGAIVWSNFGKGLRQSLDARRRTRKDQRHPIPMNATGSAEPGYKSHRLTID